MSDSINDLTCKTDTYLYWKYNRFYSNFRMTLRYLEVMYNKKIEILPFRRIIGPKIASPHPPKQNEIFVGNINELIFEDVLFPLFSKAGEIYELRLMTHETGFSRGFCFIAYNTLQAAENAIKLFNGYKLEMRFLYANKAWKEPEKPKTSVLNECPTPSTSTDNKCRETVNVPKQSSQACHLSNNTNNGDNEIVTQILNSYYQCIEDSEIDHLLMTEIHQRDDIFD